MNDERESHTTGGSVGDVATQKRGGGEPTTGNDSGVKPDPARNRNLDENPEPQTTMEPDS